MIVIIHTLNYFDKWCPYVQNIFESGILKKCVSTFDTHICVSNSIFVYQIIAICVSNLNGITNSYGKLNGKLKICVSNYCHMCIKWNGA